MTFDCQEQAVQQDGQGEACPDTDVGGVVKEALAKSLYGRGKRPKNHEEAPGGRKKGAWRLLA
jgi:hypothetical protein